MERARNLLWYANLLLYKGTCQNFRRRPIFKFLKPWGMGVHSSHTTMSKSSIGTWAREVQYTGHLGKYGPFQKHIV